MPVVNPTDYSTLDIPIDKIVTTANVRRKVGDTADLEASIRSVGLIEPVLVRELNGSGYQLIAGHRRYTAVSRIGHPAIPARVLPKSEDGELARITLQLVENLQRVDLDPIEEAAGYAQLKQYGWKQKQIAGNVGRSEGHVSKRLALLDLPDEALDLHETGRIGPEALYELSRVSSAGGDVAKLVERLSENRENEDGPIPLDAVEHLSRTALREAQTAKEVAKLRSSFESDGLRMLDGARINNGWPTYPKNVSKLSNNPIWDIHKETHESEPCHAAFVYPGYHGASVDYLCTEVSRHGPGGASEIKSDYLASSSDRQAQADKQNQEHKQRLLRAKKRNGALKAAAAGILTGRPPARGRVLDALADRWVSIMATDYGLDETALSLVGIDKTEDVDQLAELYANADGANRTRLTLACLLAEMLDNVSYYLVDEKTDRTFLTLIELLTDLGASIDIDGFEVDDATDGDSE